MRERNGDRLFVGISEGRRPLGRPRPRWMNSIKMNLATIQWGNMDWIGLFQDNTSG
jgi:hypothetical protein